MPSVVASPAALSISSLVMFLPMFSRSPANCSSPSWAASEIVRLTASLPLSEILSAMESIALSKPSSTWVSAPSATSRATFLIVLCAPADAPLTASSPNRLPAAERIFPPMPRPTFPMPAARIEIPPSSITDAIPLTVLRKPLFAHCAVLLATEPAGSSNKPKPTSAAKPRKPVSPIVPSSFLLANNCSAGDA